MNKEKNTGDRHTNNLTRVLVAGQMMELDADLGSATVVRVVSQSVNRLFTKVEDKEGEHEWWVMTYRLA